MSGETILIIDDSREIVKHLAEYVLPLYGYKTAFAYDGRTGLAYIRDQKPDLVLLDFNLPEMNGLDVLQQLAQESLNTPVVLMTAYGSELSAIESFRLGAKDYIIKPFTVDEMVSTIDRALVELRLLHDKAQLAEQLRRTKVELARQNSEMNTLSNIGKAVTSLLSVDKVLSRVQEAAVTLTNAEESTIWLHEEDGTALRAYSVGDAETGDELWPLDSPVGDVLHNGRALRQAQFSGPGVLLRHGEYARAILFVPLKLRGISIGVLGVSLRKDARNFSERDEFLLSILADYAAIALENARVFQAADQSLAFHVEELQTLFDITRTITSAVNLPEVVQLTIQQVHNSWNIEALSLWWLDEVSHSLKVLANVGTPAELLSQIEIPAGHGFVGEVADSGKPIYTNDVNTHPLHYRDVDDRTGFKTQSLLCVPLKYRGRVMGAMQMVNKQNGNFDDADVERAESIASAVAIAVNNALLFDATRAGGKERGAEAAARRLTFSAEKEKMEAELLLQKMRSAIKKMAVTGQLNAEQIAAARNLVQHSKQLYDLFLKQKDDPA